MIEFLIKCRNARMTQSEAFPYLWHAIGLVCLALITDFRDCTFHLGPVIFVKDRCRGSPKGVNRDQAYCVVSGDALDILKVLYSQKLMSHNIHASDRIIGEICWKSH